MHNQPTPAYAGENFVFRAALNPEDHVMAILPLFHVNAQFGSLWGTIAAEASLVLIRRFSASRFWEQAVRYGATEFNFIGAVGRILCNRPESEYRPEHTIKTACGTPVRSDVYECFTKKFHIENVIDGYGLTEYPLASQTPIGGLIKMNCMGVPGRVFDPNLKYVEMKIVDDDGKEVQQGEVGELLLKGLTIMKGYYKEPEKTAEAIRDGWFYTGDYVYQDEDDYYFFVDRKKDIIRKGGENISAAEVEGVINENPKVLEATVIPVPAELGEDEVMACIVLKPGETMKPEEVVDWTKDRLAPFKVPRYVQFRESIPKTVTQKVQKQVIKKEEDLIQSSHDMVAYRKSLGI
jgi:crotonobetaine/carnitine-CoA ligase